MAGIETLPASLPLDYLRPDVQTRQDIEDFRLIDGITGLIKKIVVELTVCCPSSVHLSNFAQIGCISGSHSDSSFDSLLVDHPSIPIRGPEVHKSNENVKDEYFWSLTFTLLLPVFHLIGTWHTCSCPIHLSITHGLMFLTGRFNYDCIKFCITPTLLLTCKDWCKYETLGGW